VTTAVLPGAEELRRMAEEDTHGHVDAPKAAPEETLFLNRELSWLAFNRRVLMEAAETKLPAFERLRFLSIYGTNLDEFYMVRAGGLTDRAALRPGSRDRLTGMTPKEQLDAIARETAAQLPTLERLYADVTLALSDAGVELLDADAPEGEMKTLTKKKFRELQPLLSPQIVRRGEPFPFLRNKESYIIVLLGHGKKRAVGIVPTTRLPKVFSFEADGETGLMPTPELIRRFAPSLFPGEKAEETAILRITRNAEIQAGDLIDDADADFRAVMERLLRRRRRLEPVRAQLSGDASDRMVEVVRSALDLPKKRIFRSSVPADLSFVQKLGTDVIPDSLRRQLPESSKPVALRKGDYFDYLRDHELLIALPYQRIDPFVDLLYEAADAPDVKSIRITLYRLAGSSRIAAALAYAAAQGKRVMCLLELRARFDEQNNIDYSRMLEESGCEIRYGLRDYKVHAKLCVIERDTAEGKRYITQIGTGNYNEATAEQYTDLMLLTGDPAVGHDAATALDALERGELPGKMEALIFSPLHFKSWLIRMIREQAEKGAEGRIRIQCNAMNDKEIMQELIDAGTAGCEVLLLVRGICCLRPGVPGETEHITVRSIIGRYLEHERIYAFGRGGETRVWFGSGDLLERNTMRRVEAFAEARTPNVKEELLALIEFLQLDDRKVWIMQPDGTYARPDTPGRFISQAALRDYFAGRTVKKPEPAIANAPETTRAIRESPLQLAVVEQPVQKKSLWQRFLDWLKSN
jgi:polyphosphate kinase